MGENDKKQTEVKKETSRRNQKKHSFIHNSNYYSICIYVIVTVTICAVIIRSVFMMEDTLKMLAGLIRWLMPYLLGIFLVGLLYPMVRHLTKSNENADGKWVKKHARGLAIFETYLGFVGLIVLLFAVIIPQMIGSVEDMINSVPEWYREVVTWLENLDQGSELFDLDFVINGISEYGNSMFTVANLESRLGDISEIAKTVLSTSYSVVQVLGEFLIAFIVSLYLMMDMKRIRAAALKILNAFLNKKDTETICRVSKECYEIFASFVSGKMIDSVIIGVLCCLLMTILRLPYAVVISMVVAVTNMIPYFGPFIGMIPGTFVMIMESPLKAVIFLCMILALQQFDGWVLGPRILGSSTGLRPAWIIFSVAAGGAIAGVIGMFLGVPVAAVIGHLLNIWIESHKRKTGADSD